MPRRNMNYKHQTMDTIIFTDKNKAPDDKDLKLAIGNTYKYWQILKDDVHKKYPEAKDEWNFPGVKYGWSFRIKDKKRAIIYLLPKDKYFRVAMVFGQKAFDAIMRSNISKEIKKELESAKVYAEGRGIRIDVKDESVINDIKELISVKIAN
jgi:hypothetical protein